MSSSLPLSATSSPTRSTPPRGSPMRAPAMLRLAVSGLALAALLAATPPVEAFYLPGVAPTDFAKVRTRFLPPEGASKGVLKERLGDVFDIGMKAATKNKWIGFEKGNKDLVLRKDELQEQLRRLENGEWQTMRTTWAPSRSRAPRSSWRCCRAGAVVRQQVWQHCHVDEEGGDRGGEQRELVAAGLDGTALVSGDRGGC